MKGMAGSNTMRNLVLARQSCNRHLNNWTIGCEFRKVRLTETISVHFFGRLGTRKGKDSSKITKTRKSQNGMKRSNKALPELIPPRICITFCHASVGFRPTKLESLFLGAPDRQHRKYLAREMSLLFEKCTNHEHRSKMEPYWTYRAENQAF